MTSTQFKKPAFFIPGPIIVALAKEVEPGKFICTYGGKDIDELQKSWPEVAVGEYSEIRQQQERQYVTAPRKIDRDTFIEALEVLPPKDWIQRADTSSFKMSEFYTGNITSIYVRLGSDYFEFRDDADMTHESIVEKIKASQN